MVKSLPIRITKPLVPHTNRNTQTSKLYSHCIEDTAHCRQAAIAQTSAHGAFGFPTGNCQNLRRQNCQRQGKRYFALALVGSSVVSRRGDLHFFPCVSCVCFVSAGRKLMFSPCGRSGGAPRGTWCALLWCVNRLLGHLPGPVLPSGL